MLQGRKDRNRDTPPDRVVITADLVAITTVVGFLARRTAAVKHRVDGAYYTAMAGRDSLVASYPPSSSYCVQRQKSLFSPLLYHAYFLPEL